MHPTPLHLLSHVRTTLVVVGDLHSLKEAAAPFGGAVTLLEKPAGSNATIADDNDRTFSPDAAGPYVVRLGTHGKPGWRHATIYAAPAAIDTHPAFRGKGRHVWRALLATEPLASLDMSNVTDRTPWPRVTNATTGEVGAPDFAHYGG